ncbi:hypothetical protein GCM10011392_01000 [Wenxinia marina]|nr:hypothetical protein GCM10011392_01000 [Wenxinia marina]
MGASATCGGGTAELAAIYPVELTCQYHGKRQSHALGFDVVRSQLARAGGSVALCPQDQQETV